MDKLQYNKDGEAICLNKIGKDKHLCKTRVFYISKTGLISCDWCGKSYILTPDDKEAKRKSE